MSRIWCVCLVLAALSLPTAATAGGIGSQAYVVERAAEAMAIYDFEERRILPERIEGLGNMRHATMAFSQNLRWGYVATRNGLLSRVDLLTRAVDAEVQTSQNSIDIAISQDGRWIAVAEYLPGGLTILDAAAMTVAHRFEADPLDPNYKEQGKLAGTAVGRSRVTGIVDAPGGRFVCVQMEAGEIWIITTSGGEFAIEHRIKTPRDLPYDAMITPDGRYYVVGHLGSDMVSVLDLTKPEDGIQTISLLDPKERFERKTPVKLPHMASWAVAGDSVYVPLVGEKRLVVLDRYTWAFKKSVPVKGHPVYAVSSPTQREIWVSFSGEEDDMFVDVIDTQKQEVTRSIEVGRRIYHMDFTPRGAYVLVSANADNTLALIDATTYEIVDRQTVASPSGVFGIWRAFRIGL
jgi:protein NirF